MYIYCIYMHILYIYAYIYIYIYIYVYIYIACDGDAVDVLKHNQVLYGPAIAANAGGMIVNQLEVIYIYIYIHIYIYIYIWYYILCNIYISIFKL